jgi:hypothetical protein
MHSDFATFCPFSERILRNAKDIEGFNSVEVAGSFGPLFAFFFIARLIAGC